MKTNRILAIVATVGAVTALVNLTDLSVTRPGDTGYEFGDFTFSVVSNIFEALIWFPLFVFSVIVLGTSLSLDNSALRYAGYAVFALLIGSFILSVIN